MPNIEYSPVRGYVLASAAFLAISLFAWTVLAAQIFAYPQNTAHIHGLVSTLLQVRVYVTANLLTGFSYVLISLTLAYLVYRARSTIPFHWVVLAFGVFILTCGSGHFIHIVTMANPLTGLMNSVDVLTALASVTTAIVLPPLIPKTLALIETATAADERKQQLEAANLHLQNEIAERQRLEEELRQQRDLYFSLLQGLSEVGEGVIVSDNHTIVFANQAACEISGYQHAELLTFDSPLTIDAPSALAHDPGRAELPSEIDIGRYETSLRHKDGHTIPTEVASQSIYYGDRAQRIVVFRDITERKQAEAAMRRSEQRYRWLATLAPVGIFETDDQGRCSFANEQWEAITGMDRATALGDAWMAAVHADDRAHIHSEWLASMQRGTPYQQALRYQRPDGRVVWAVVAAVALHDAAGKTTGYLGTVTDITAREQDAEQLRASLAEKDVLLKEVHHRVKNNLQVIVSLLRLQITALKEPAAQEPLHDCQNRVIAMALVHEQLYGSQDLAHLHFAAYVQSLASSILRSYQTSSTPIQLIVQVAESVLLDLETAIPLGLILTELIANSVKHAFPGNRSGSITVAFQTADDGAALIVQDNGIGIGDDLDITSLPSLGLKLVQRLVMQLDGTLDIHRQGGLTVRITIPLHTGVTL